jgi:serine/threonine protein kinase
MGAYGKVWRADLTVLSPTEHRIEVAVKSIKDDATRKDINNFLLEAETLKAVNVSGGHKNVLKLIGCSLQELPPLIITEYAAHGSLKIFLEFKLRPQGNIDIKLLLRFAREAAAGMAFLSHLQIVHRGRVNHVLGFQTHSPCRSGCPQLLGHRRHVHSRF